MENESWQARTETLIGKENLLKLQNSNIVIFGLGGVGSYVVEGLVRAGVQNIGIVDKDVIDITNINRQLIADTTTIGKSKVDVEEKRILDINPTAKIIKIKEFVDKNNIEKIMNNILSLNNHIDYVVDAIDTISSKLEIIKYCKQNNINIISCMGTGNKLNANMFEITDINKTSVCPVAKIIRKELKKLEISSLKVLYSKEIPIKNIQSVSPASISFVEMRNIDTKNYKKYLFFLYFCDIVIYSQFYLFNIGGAIIMAKCEICEKSIAHGNKISIARSHVSRRTTRTFKPNLRRVKAIINGDTKTIHVCSKCLRSGKVNRA